MAHKHILPPVAGPVTILNWSFPRKDITRQAQAFQLALAIREEVADLEKAGCRVIQVHLSVFSCQDPASLPELHADSNYRTHHAILNAM